MCSKIESLKANIEAGFLSNVMPKDMANSISLRAFQDMIQINFKEKVADSVRVRVGFEDKDGSEAKPVFRVRPGLVVGYSLNVKKSIGDGLVFIWKDSIKPSGFIDIQNRILDLYT